MSELDKILDSDSLLEVKKYEIKTIMLEIYEKTIGIESEIERGDVFIKELRKL